MHYECALPIICRIFDANPIRSQGFTAETLLAPLSEQRRKLLKPLHQRLLFVPLYQRHQHSGYDADGSAHAKARKEVRYISTTHRRTSSTK